jgi:hypothetical protein
LAALLLPYKIGIVTLKPLYRSSGSFLSQGFKGHVYYSSLFPEAQSIRLPATSVMWSIFLNKLTLYLQYINYQEKIYMESELKELDRFLYFFYE